MHPASAWRSECAEQGTLKERFARVPFVKNTRGESSGLVGFDKALTEDEISYVKEHLKTLSGKEVTWSVPDGPSLRYCAGFRHADSRCRGDREGIPARACTVRCSACCPVLKSGTRRPGRRTWRPWTWWARRTWWPRRSGWRRTRPARRWQQQRRRCGLLSNTCGRRRADWRKAKTGRGA